MIDQKGAAMYLVTRHARPGPRLWHPQPGRLNPRASDDTAAAEATARKLHELEADWLWERVGAEGRRRLLIEAGLLPR